MKKLLLSLLAVSSLFLFNSCEDGLINFNVEQSVAAGTIVIGATNDVGTTDFSETIVGLNIDSILEANGVKVADLKSVTVKSIELEILNAATSSFDPFQSFESILETPGLEPIIVTQYDGFPDGATLVKIDGADITDVDFKDYVTATDFQFKGNITNDQPIPEDVTLAIRVNFNIKAGK